MVAKAPRHRTPELAISVVARNGSIRERWLEDQFRQFRQVSSDFVRALEAHADFRTDGRGDAAANANLRVVRSLFGKWSIDILVLLYSEHQMGYSEMRRALPGISSRVLSSKLRALEEQGVIRRDVLATRPPRVQYGLTERGLTVTKLGEPVLLFLRVYQGLYEEVPGTSAQPSSDFR